MEKKREKRKLENYAKYMPCELQIQKPNLICVSKKSILKPLVGKTHLHWRILVELCWGIIMYFRMLINLLLRTCTLIFKPNYDCWSLSLICCLFLLIFCQNILIYRIRILWVHSLQTLTRQNSSTRVTWGFNDLLHILIAIVIPMKVA